MPRIRLLSDHLVSQIAAGEVVERPASVVKELVENALDAGALDLRVDLEGGGRQRIVVADDGYGMGRDDALLAFDRHATSKIATFEDLERVATLGFRGEALSSIAAVARVDLTTAERPGDGHRVRIEGGRVVAVDPFSRPRGTTVEVRSLFFNVPARRKFLKSKETELRRCLEVVQGYALARPDVRFLLVHEDRPLLEALAAPEGAAGERRRIAQIFGESFAARLAEIPPEVPEVPETPEIAGEEREGEAIGGFVGDPETARGHRHFVFVNRRLVRDRLVMGTFYRAVREEWRSEEFPALFLFLDLLPEEVDVNVHPQKAEVRFHDPGIVDRLSRALRRGLERARGEVPAPLRQPPAGPSVPFAWQGLGEADPAAWRRDPGASPWPGSGSGPGAASELREAPAGYSSGPAGSPARYGGPTGGSAGYSGGPSGSPAGYPGVPAGGPAGTPGGASPFPGGGAGAFSPGGGPGALRLPTASYAPISRPMVPLSGRRGEARPFRLLGQYKGTLILLEGPDGLYLIDQHVAHERILYERLRRSLNQQGTPSQSLFTPALLDLGPAERMRLAEMAPELEECGFGLATLSNNTLALTAVPAVLTAGEAEALLATLGSEEDGDGASPEGLRLRILEALAASLACKAAVKMHHPLAPLEMEALVAELFAAEQPYACPHGRPIVLQMTDSDLERRFGRRG